VFVCSMRQGYSRIVKGFGEFAVYRAVQLNPRCTVSTPTKPPLPCIAAIAIITYAPPPELLGQSDPGPWPRPRHRLRFKV
jgi:hypothetical protein